MNAQAKRLPILYLKLPVITQTKTISNEIPKLTNSAIVNLPQPPKEILFFFPHDLQLN